jgi:ABC-2 type transport system permease protein
MDTLEIKANLRFAGALLRTSLRSALALRGAFLVEMLFMALNNLIFFVFWWALFSKVPSIRGHQLADVAILYGIVAIGYGLQAVFAGGARDLGRLIVEGELDPYLTQPKPPLLAVLGSRCQASGIGDIASGFFLIGLLGEPSGLRMVLVFLAAVSSAVVWTASITLFWCLAFWFGQVDGVVRQLFETTLSFSLYPERLFGGKSKLVLYTLIPSAYIGHLPAKWVLEPRVGVALALSAVAVSYLGLADWVFHLGLRRYASGSRFGVHG